MLLKDQIKIYIATKQPELAESQSVASYINLRSVMANVQYMSNREEQKNYGVITNAVIVIRAQNPVQAQIGDGVYLSQPVEADSDCGEPDYFIESVKTAYFGIVSVHNPITITARINNNK